MSAAQQLFFQVAEVFVGRAKRVVQLAGQTQAQTFQLRRQERCYEIKVRAIVEGMVTSNHPASLTRTPTPAKADLRTVALGA